MAIINLSPFLYDLSINGASYISAMVEGQFNTSPENDSGLFFLSGVITLAQHDLNLDPRTNFDLFPGNVVLITRNNTAEVVPIFGTMYVTQATFDTDIQDASLSLGCWLSLTNKASFDQTGVCISDVESGISKQQAITSLLTAAGIPLANIDVSAIPGTILENISVDRNTSFVQKAGEIAYSEGYALYQANDGVVKAQFILDRVTKLGSAIAIDEELLVQYSMRPDATSIPPGKTKVRGNRLWPARARNDIYREELTAGEFGISFQTFLRQWDADARLGVQRDNLVGPLGAVTQQFGNEELLLNLSILNVSETYEPKPIGGTCTDPDEGRLLRRESIETRPRAYGAEEWLLIKAESDGVQPEDMWGTTSPMNNEQIIEDWEYNTPTNLPIVGHIALDESGNFINSEGLPENVLLDGQFYVRKIRTVYRPRAIIFPLIADGKLTRDPELEPATIFVNDFSPLFPAEREDTIWILNPDGETWTQVSKFSRSAWQQTQGAIRNMLERLNSAETAYSYTLSTVVDSAIRLVEYRVVVDHNTSPSTPGRFPPRTRYGRTPWEICATMQGAPQAIGSRVDSKTVPDEVPLAKANDFAQMLLLREWGRANAFLINMADDSMPVDFSPLGNVSVTEFNTGAIYSYELDSINLAINRNEAFYAGIGLLIGIVDGTEIINIWERGFDLTSGISISSTFQCSELVTELALTSPGYLTITSEFCPDDLEVGILALDEILNEDGLLFAVEG